MLCLCMFFLSVFLLGLCVQWQQKPEEGDCSLRTGVRVTVSFHVGAGNQAGPVKEQSVPSSLSSISNLGRVKF